ncbi:LysR family transcriptional regulator [Liquorilactobacillus satsumensis]|nr:LysR family transcriptional regulator [Liquorilactobacillus satsumensis]MCC7667078.1 LysR family transcriptional regulator [Liquorilactobacillus satsumensis]MCP9328492.1 LysR family transcriptional regulator [Liquorilactobacillus satsumensis]MCP9358264.1 LysR family transcriptional regulator [Liquorilactobacillus satsumensis]MCP9372218.1 LysR family transcriptional regulator [Liquorilactobacillus satsumensis]
MKTKQDSIFSSKTLTYFLQLAETMSYTQAAQILGITQPALTQQIKKLERTVGAPLFYSVGKKLHLSDAGYTMLDATHQIYETLNEAADEIQQSTSALHGEIHLGILASIEDRVFSQFAVEYYMAHRSIKITFHMLTRKEIWELLENNEIDLAIMYLPDESIKNWKPYQSKLILTEDLLFLHNRPEFFKKKNIRLRDTTGNDWVTYPPGYYLHSTMLEAYKNSMIDPPSSVAYFAKPGQIFEFARATDVYTALPASFVRAHNATAAGTKLHVAHFEPAIKFDLAFVFRKGKNQIPRIANFLKEFDDYLTKQDYNSRLTEISNQG